MISITILEHTFQCNADQLATAGILVLLIICGCLTIAMCVNLYKILSAQRKTNDCKCETNNWKSLRAACNVNLRETPSPWGSRLAIIPYGAIVKVDPDQDVWNAAATGYIRVRYKRINGYALKNALREPD